jgi:hypothetical protein
VTLLREHRGDGHVSALVAAGVDPCEAHVLRVAYDGASLESIQPYRGWTDTDWSAAAERLEERGWLAGGVITTEGARVRSGIEADTDRLSAMLVDRIQDLDVVLDVLEAIDVRLQGAGALPYPNPIGLPAPGRV